MCTARPTLPAKQLLSNSWPAKQRSFVELPAHFSRVGMPDVPIPYVRELEYAVVPTAARIEAAVRKAVAA